MKNNRMKLKKMGMEADLAFPDIWRMSLRLFQAMKYQNQKTKFLAFCNTISY